MIAGTIEESSKDEQFEAIPSITGIVLELVVSETYQEKNIGSLHISKMEEFFKIKKCTILSVDVLEPNRKTHIFYQKLGYQDRLITMTKNVV